MVKYAYAVGRLRALEARLINDAQIIRMTEAPDLQSAFLVLGETPYSEKIDRLPQAFDFEELLKQELISTKQLLDNLAPKDEILDVIFKKYDYHNLKVLLKNKLTGGTSTKALYEIGTLPWHELERLEIAQKAEGQDLRSIENTIDKEYLRILSQVAKLKKVPLFSEYVKIYKISAEIKIALRSGRGNIEEVAKKYRYTDFNEALEKYQASGNLFTLEKELDDLLLLKIKRARYFTFGVEPLIGFLHAKEVELKIVRLILVAKLNRLKTELIKERLRTSYV